MLIKLSIGFLAGALISGLITGFVTRSVVRNGLSCDGGEDPDMFSTAVGVTFLSTQATTTTTIAAPTSTVASPVTSESTTSTTILQSTPPTTTFLVSTSSTSTAVELPEVRLGQGNSIQAPANFLWGTASASYQIEGAHDQNGRGWANWDYYTHVMKISAEGRDTGDDGAKFLEMMDDDVELFKDLGINSLRFSIAWSRVIPTGFMSSEDYLGLGQWFDETVDMVQSCLNEHPRSFCIPPQDLVAGWNSEGASVYHTLLDKLEEANIEPMITMYHWDTPLPLQSLGGWQDRRFVDHFVDYAEQLLRNFGSRCKKWIVLNEPSIGPDLLELGYIRLQSGRADRNVGGPLTSLEDYAVKRLLVRHHQVLASARVYALAKELKAAGVLPDDVEVGTTLAINPFEAENFDSETLLIRDYMDLLWIRGDLDAAVRGEYSEDFLSYWDGVVARAAPQSVLGDFILDGDLDLLSGNTADFLGINYYTVTKAIATEDVFGATPDTSNYEHANGFWRPDVLRNLLMAIRADYGNIPTYITENGYGPVDETANDVLLPNGTVDDHNRCEYVSQHVAAVLDAANQGANVRGYALWSSHDNLEWHKGYASRFGAIYVDFDNDYKRYPKKSFYAFRKIIQQNGVFNQELCEELSGGNRQRAPDYFLWSTASSSYQIEGYPEGRGWANWDYYTHVLNAANGHVGDQGSMLIEKMDEDIQIFKNLGINSLRFSLSWPRLIPTGFMSNPPSDWFTETDTVTDCIANHNRTFCTPPEFPAGWHDDGEAVYTRLLDKLDEAGIEPMITLYHWDHPLHLQALGGWESLEFVDRFLEYAEEVLRRLGNRCKKWIILNEPSIGPDMIETAFIRRPLGQGDPNTGSTVASEQDYANSRLKIRHHQSLVTARVVALGKRLKAEGVLDNDVEIGTTLAVQGTRSENHNPENLLAMKNADLVLQRGDLDAAIRGRYSDDWMSYWAGIVGAELFNEVVKDEHLAEIADNTIDFLGINYYSPTHVLADPTNLWGYVRWSLPNDHANGQDRPEVLKEFLLSTITDYGNIPTYITENGYGPPDGSIDEVIDGKVDDHNRCDFVSRHIAAVLDAYRQGVDLRSYTLWSSHDNFEWISGYTTRFGSIYVDYDNDFIRIPKKSYYAFKQIIADGGTFNSTLCYDVDF